MDCFSQACNDFGPLYRVQCFGPLTISLNKTNTMGQDKEASPVITIHDYELDAVCQFTHLGSTITDNYKPVIGRTDRQEDCEVSFNSRSSVNKSRTVGEYQIWWSAMPTLPARCGMAAIHELHMLRWREYSTTFT